MQQVKWFDRKFNFESTQNIIPSIIERLWGTPARLEEKLKLIPAHLQTLSEENSWTIKENIGHLTNLEPLWQGRLEDILTGKEEFRATDLQNTRTTEANHNAKPVEELLADFRKVRIQTIPLLANLTEEQVFKSALHPRLKTPMWVMDLFLFVADHDDHHLARITELAKG
ncbi:MAG: DinB family protein [Cytophagaceae bacterium]|nr:MAG: DinB family protein [Cytophagaceae bacterium]